MPRAQLLTTLDALVGASVEIVEVGANGTTHQRRQRLLSALTDARCNSHTMLRYLDCIYCRTRARQAVKERVTVDDGEMVSNVKAAPVYFGQEYIA